MTEPRPPRPAEAEPGTGSTALLRWGVVAAGAALFVLLVVAGALSRDESSRAWAASGALLAVLALAALLVVQLGKRTARPWLLYALVPASAALATLTWLLGWVGFPGAWAWWVPGAIVSALPLWTLGFLGRRGAGTSALRRPRATDRP